MDPNKEVPVLENSPPLDAPKPKPPLGFAPNTLPDDPKLELLANKPPVVADPPKKPPPVFPNRPCDDCPAPDVPNAPPPNAPDVPKEGAEEPRVDPPNAGAVVPNKDVDDDCGALNNPEPVLDEPKADCEPKADELAPNNVLPLDCWLPSPNAELCPELPKKPPELVGFAPNNDDWL